MNSTPRQRIDVSDAQPGSSLHEELVKQVMRFAPSDGTHTSCIRGLTLGRASSPSRPLSSLCEPSLCLVVQGSKRAVLGNDVYVYDALKYLVISMTLPMAGQILEASSARPYLSLRISLDVKLIGELLLQVGSAGPPRDYGTRAMYVAHGGTPLLDAALRLIRLLDQPDDAVVLAPLILREIHYWVLKGAFGNRLRELCMVESQTHRITRAINLLTTRFAQTVRIDDLVTATHMSASSLHHRFKAVTALSPLQFQKQLRLHEARRLMMVEGLDATSAAHRVGYESASQFSREYRRLFGAPPRREIGIIRDSAIG